jgi:hypothetical protein
MGLGKIYLPPEVGLIFVCLQQTLEDIISMISYDIYHMIGYDMISLYHFFDDIDIFYINFEA